MQGSVIKPGTKIYGSIIAENVEVGENCTIGVGEYADSKLSQKIYNCDLTVIGERLNYSTREQLVKCCNFRKTEPSDI